MKLQPGRAVSVEAPASSANLGPGFDALALALELRLRVRVEALAAAPSVLEVAGEGEGRLGVDGSNRFVAGLERGLAEAGVERPPAWRIAMANEIPLGRGLGSSAAATVCGLVAAGALVGDDFGPARLLLLATDIEGHPDNAAAAIHGGFVVVAGGHVARFEPPAGLRVVVFVADRELPTDRMRAALPETVARTDAVHNVGLSALVVAAMAGGDLSLLAAASDDRLHEPYRAQIYPELGALKQAALAGGAIGAALSGAGSSIIAFCGPADAASVGDAMEAAARRTRLGGRALALAPRSPGARVT